MTARWLVADLGGTNARFGLAAASGTIVRQATIPTTTATSLTGLVEAYLDMVGGGPLTHACVACAGPVVEDVVRLTNADVTFSVERTRDELGLERLHVVNDFAAIARSLPALSAADLIPVGECSAGEVPGPRLAIGPGTGLGVAAAVPTRDGWTVLPGEGGHVSFSGLYDDELELIKQIRKETGFVSAEMLLSGPGLTRLYRHAAGVQGDRPELSDRPEHVVERAVRGRDDASTRALHMFCRLLGAVAADAALTTGATGGVYLAGGIVGRFPEFLARSEFRERFCTHPHQRAYLSDIRTSIITTPQPGLVGALQFLLEDRASWLDRV